MTEYMENQTPSESSSDTHGGSQEMAVSSSNTPLALAESTRRAIERAEVLGQSGISTSQQRTLEWVAANDNSSNADTVSNQCSICLEDVPQAGAPIDRSSDERNYLPCAHFFHDGCITRWLQDFGSVCPICRRDPSQAERELLGAPSPVPSPETSSTTDGYVASIEERVAVSPLLLTLLLATRYPGLFLLFEDLLPPSILELLTQTNIPLVRSPRVSVHEDETASISSDSTVRLANTADAREENEEPECAICMLPLQQADQEATATLDGVTNSTDQTSRPSALPCGHTFHSVCISTWLVESYSSWGVRRCPMCRYELNWQAAQAILNPPPQQQQQRQQQIPQQTPTGAQRNRPPPDIASLFDPLYQNDPNSTETIVPQTVTYSQPPASTSRNNHGPSGPSYLVDGNSGQSPPSPSPVQRSTRLPRNNEAQQLDIDSRLQYLSTLNIRRSRTTRTSQETIPFQMAPATYLNDPPRRTTNTESTSAAPNHNIVPNNCTTDPFTRLGSLPPVPTTIPGDTGPSSSQSTGRNEEEAYGGIAALEAITDAAIPERPAPVYGHAPRHHALVPASTPAQQDTSESRVHRTTIPEGQSNAHTRPQPALAERSQTRAPLPNTLVTQQPVRTQPMTIYTHDIYCGSKDMGHCCSECCDCIGCCIKEVAPWVVGVGLVYAAYAFIRHVIIPACAHCCCCCCGRDGYECWCKRGHECCC
jgi:hypothetical protein